MSEIVHQTIHQSDYTPPDYLIETVELTFDLDAESTTVLSRLSVRSNYQRSAGPRPLVFDGEELVLLSLKLDGEELSSEHYTLDDHHLTIAEVPESFQLE